MADERILAGVLRWWDVPTISSAYQAVLTAYSSSMAKEVTIIGTSFDGQGTNAQVTLDREAMATWLDVLEAALKAKEAETVGEAELVSGSPVVDFRFRRVGT